MMVHIWLYEREFHTFCHNNNMMYYLTIHFCLLQVSQWPFILKQRNSTRRYVSLDEVSKLGMQFLLLKSLNILLLYVQWDFSAVLNVWFGIIMIMNSSYDSLFSFIVCMRNKYFVMDVIFTSITKKSEDIKNFLKKMQLFSI